MALTRRARRFLGRPQAAAEASRSGSEQAWRRGDARKQPPGKHEQASRRGVSREQPPEKQEQASRRGDAREEPPLEEPDEEPEGAQSRNEWDSLAQACSACVQSGEDTPA